MFPARIFLAICLAIGAAPATAQTLEQMAGQMILIGFSGSDPEAVEVGQLAEAISRGELGGVMYLKTNVASLQSVTAMNRKFSSGDAVLPPFLALDQEGGQIERLTSEVGFREIPSAESVAGTMSPGDAQSTYATMALAISELGFNLNFGPVVDLNRNPDNPIIARYGRAFGTDPETVAAYADAFISAHRGAGVRTALKHFPGHGSSRADSHEGFVDISGVWSQSELNPYRTLIAQGRAEMVMVGHLYHLEFDSTGKSVPASLSPDWISGVLRGNLGFNGVVVSDDLEMAAIREHYSLDETVERAVMAGTDILLFSNTADHDPNRAAKIRDIIVRKATADPVFHSRVEQSYLRIKALKGGL